MPAIDRIGPSENLLGLLKEFGEKLNNARDLWDRIRLEGANEGFDERQLAEMVRPYLKERGLTQQQIWYLFHRDEQRQRSQDQYKRLTTNISGTDDKNDLEESTSNVRIPISGKVIDQDTNSMASTRLSPSSSGEELENVEYDLSQAAETRPESLKKPNLRRLEIPLAKDIIDDESYEWQPKDENVEFLKKQLNKQIEENQQKDILIEQLQEEKTQLSEAVKKNSFTIATNYKPDPRKKFEFPEPDGYNTFVWKNISFDKFRMGLGPLKATANTKINVYLERVI